MTKSDFPALRMRVDRGKLVPASQFDQERIDSYRNGAVVMVRMTEERDRVLVKKWFAILGLVLKTCNTPWKTKEQAHEAIKLALGIVNVSKTVSGQFMQYPKSLSELDDPELQEALEQMTELLSRMTGVDVATLRKEAADVGQAIADEEQANTDDAASASAASGEAGADEIPAASVPASPSLETPWIVTAARMLWAATNANGDTDENIRLIKAQKAAVRELMPEDTPKPIREKAQSIFDNCEQVVMRSLDPADAKAIIAGIAGITEEDLSNG